MAEGLPVAAGGAGGDAGVDSRAAVAESKQAMSFLDELRAHLREGGRLPESADATSALLNLPSARQYFLQALERREASDEWLPEDIAKLHQKLSGGWFERFIARAAREMKGGLRADASAAALQGNVHAAIDALIDDGIGGAQTVEAREIERVAMAAAAYAESFPRGAQVTRYAFENRLIRGSGSHAVVSPLGRVLLDLPEMDAVRWLITLEAQQSADAGDELHLHPDVLKVILATPSHYFEHGAFVEDEIDPMSPPIADDERWPFQTPMFERLRELRVIECSTDDDGWGYSLVPAYRPTLEDIVSRRRTPFSLLAESLLADERNSVAGYALAAPSHEEAAERQARHARMVVHEIRNAIVPMEMALSELFALLPPEREPSWRPQRERLERGVERLLRFADNLEQVVRLGSPDTRPFDLVAAVRDAVKALNGGLKVAVTFEPEDGLPPLLGDGARFALVVVNLLRNAAQNNPAAGAAVRLRASLGGDRAVHLTVDDNGPGVPEEHREAIFRQGFALRSGGSGQGLALVREVVEREMRGSVRCDRSELGGARFLLTFPVTPKENP